MTNLVGAVHKMSCLPEKGMHSSGNNNGLDLSLLAGGAREHSITRILGDRQRFTGKSRLVDLQRIAF